MYKILTVNDKVRVPPNKFALKLEEAVQSSLEDKWEGLIDRNMGVILAVVSVGEIGEGRILPGDGAIHYPVDFQLLVFFPELHDLVKGYVIDVTEFGVFIRIGPVDGMVHVSQIMDDFVSYDQKNSVFLGRDSKRILKSGDNVRARVISISMGGNQYKIGLTTRQPGLGVLDWYKEKPKSAKKPEEKPTEKKPSKAEPKKEEKKKGGK
jgi:DNA-directed RNA polymerase subunit E'